MTGAGFRLYLVTDRRQTAGRPLPDVVEAALQGGVDAVQLREKDLPARDLAALAERLAGICRRHRARLLVNDRVDVALAVGADGVHLPADSFAPADARRLLGPEALIGVSTHTLADARAAQDAGADFVVFGPLFDTPAKRIYGPPLGLAALAEVTRAVRLPVLAIGGVRAAHVAAVRRHGAAGVAVVSAILGAGDPSAAAAALAECLQP
jgi:thiamine-phosphate pyrophosphorylase